jgi:hypothetical protein
LEEALKDPQNEHFIFVSGSCIPLKSFDYTYAYLKPAYSYFSMCPKECCFPRSDHALSYIDKKYIQKSHQWCILNRKHARLMTETHDYLEWFVNIPDEHCYITNLYVHELEHELVLSTDTHADTTFTNWQEDGLKNYDSISEKELDRLFKSKHLFGRKFNPECNLSTLQVSLSKRQVGRSFHLLIMVCILLFVVMLSITLWQKESG